MNIFVLDENPKAAAQQLCDQHIVKMPTETSQMLACALIANNAPKEALPLTKKGTVAKGGYPHHPCSKWAGESEENFLWLCEHGIALSEEYFKRYGKEHFCNLGIRKMMEHSGYLPCKTQTPFAIAINNDSECRSLPEFYEANTMGKYRLFYKYDKPFAKWKNDNRPFWLDLSNKSIILKK